MSGSCESVADINGKGREGHCVKHTDGHTSPPPAETLTLKWVTFKASYALRLYCTSTC